MGFDTLANVKSRLGITSTTYDTFLQQQVDLVSEVIEGYLGRKLAENDYVQTFYDDNNSISKKMVLYHFPVTDISIEQDGQLLDDEAYRLHKPSGIVKALDTTFFASLETVVEYTAGYADGEIPLPILSVLDSIVQERYNKKTSGVDLNFGSDIQRISIPGAISIDFDYTLTNNERTSAFGTIIGNNANILDPYRSERAVIGTDTLEFVEEAP